jgi:hypothetical protein
MANRIKVRAPQTTSYATKEANIIKLIGIQLTLWCDKLERFILVNILIQVLFHWFLLK